MTFQRQLYRVARSVLFTAIITVVALYLIIYVLLSVPAVQMRIKEVAEREASAFLGGKVSIDRLTVKPFNEVVISGLAVADSVGKRCLYVETVGAGINIYRLLRERRLEFTYGEIIGLNANIVQPSENAPLNIAFIIDAFKPKDKTKPPTKFDLTLRNVVLRRCAATFDREWKPRREEAGVTDFNHLNITGLRADINLPRLKNDDFLIDLRRLSFRLSGGLNVEKIAFQTHITSNSISVNNLIIALPGTDLRPSDFSLNFKDFHNIKEALAEGNHALVMLDNRLTPSDFSCFWSPLANLHNPMTISLEINGNLERGEIKRLMVEEEEGVTLYLDGDADSILTPNAMTFNVNSLNVNIPEHSLTSWLSLLPKIGERETGVIKKLCPLSFDIMGGGDTGRGDYHGQFSLSSACGNLMTEGKVTALKNGRGLMKVDLLAEGINIGAVTGHPEIGEIFADVSFDGKINGRDIDGVLETNVGEFTYRGTDLGGISLYAKKEGKDIEGKISLDNSIGVADVEGEVHIEEEHSRWNIDADIERFIPSSLGFLPKYPDYRLSAQVNFEAGGNNVDNLEGVLTLNDFNFRAEGKPSLSLSNLSVKSENGEEGRKLELTSDWADMELAGQFRLKEIPGEIKCVLANVFPSLMECKPNTSDFMSSADFSLLIHPDNTLTEFFGLPVRLLVPVMASGVIDGPSSTARIGIDIPYLQQGRNKLIRNSRLVAEADGITGNFNVDLSTTVPAKKGEMVLDMKLWGGKDNILADIGWNTPENTDFKGEVSLDAMLSRNPLTHRPEVDVEIKPSIFDAGSARWNIGRGTLAYHDGGIKINGLRIWHDNQFVEIKGIASPSTFETLEIKLADIDLDYIFETLNINYVMFGGTATGSIQGSGVLSKEPILSTENLSVRNLSYNGAVLGYGDIRSRWVNDSKKVEIKADITKEGKKKAFIDGGIWVTRDSLAFSIDADRIPVDFLAPFMSAFSSEVSGYATGKAQLFGTFSDIDLTGRVFADSLKMKLDYTNTFYHGSDSVFLYPGKIEIPSFRLYDRDGHSAVLSGELTHRYFHDPRFTFRLSDARHLLCYDTNSALNPDWYGTVYGNGSAVVRGWPGVVSVSVDMGVTGPSAFTFVLNDTEAAQDYPFLTFSDHRKEESKSVKDTVPDILASFRKKMNVQETPPSNFILDLRASVFPDALFTLVMDPVAGDKITARGKGALQMEYNTEGDELKMFGKYVLEEGNYNFSLQDLILKDFVIREGSTISFNGDPMNAMLDITASYRVNTNLSDLDKSFSTDRELNRTNVPVDALLMVKGEMQQPDISFDIELPTLTQDVVRKVKSIISTDDMMSRQIIYLLALNRFYTPEYMGLSSNGGELAAVASSTLSSQLTNMIGQLTDKFTLAPSIRSDKGDFSDVEFDVALSSRLLNNRLLINGNFGYRDRSTSTTTFVGDFDIEYLLNRSGNLRLKAYNHFNDQNYYLREALTTQGLGVVYRKDFDDAFKWLRPRRRTVNDVKHEDEKPEEEKENLPDENK